MRRAILVLVASVVACAGGGSQSPGGDVTPNDPVVPTPASTNPPGAPPGTTPPATLPPCAGVPDRCDAWNVRAHCVVSAGAPTWVTETCGGGCYAGACSATACADECALGTSCKLWDMKTSAFVPADPAGTLHDRARDYDRILRAIDLPEGQVMNAHYTDATYTTIATYGGYHDAAIWTGSALAAEAFRVRATRDPDGEAQLAALVKTLHRSLSISGDPGYLARTVVASGAAGTKLDDTNHCADPEFHCNVTWQGATYDWLGATSRDQYTGVILGYALAYQATTDEATKAIIRGDLVTIANELMKVQTVPASIVINGIPLQKDLTLENVILAPSEMTDGRVTINLSTSSTDDAQIRGMRELFPDFGVLAKQALGLGIPILRPTTSMVLGAIIRSALTATEGVPASKTDHDKILAYYQAHAPGWLDVAAGWTFDSNCGNGYFANHLAMIMAYTWAAQEKDPALAPRIANDVLDAKLWAALGGHKNVYFAYLWGGTRPAPSKLVTDAASGELAQFSPGPRIHVPRANASAAKYLPHDSKCTSPVLCDTATLAVDVGERVLEDFLWQRQPWQLADGGWANEVYPGVDYLAAYWAGRSHGFLADDRAGTCTRHAP